MTRSAAKFWWKQEPPKEVAYLIKDGYGVDWKPVTYKEIYERKKAKQERSIQYKMRTEITKPCFLWVFYNNTWLFGGWWVYIKTLKEDYAVNFRNPDRMLLSKIINLFPCGILPLKENFSQWAEKFAKTYPHIGFKRTKQGLKKCYCKIDEYGRIADIYRIEK